MFGITRLTQEEKAEHNRKKRLVLLEKLIQEEGVNREVSLAKAQSYQQEYDSLRKG